jgi:predicted ATP-grasp superfamily ATP-dependent carboligase
MTHVLVVGVSTRAAAESAARAGFAVTAIDAFGDLDQHPAVRIVSLGGDFSAHAAARAARDVACDTVVYLANFENHPKAIQALGDGRTLWGNPADVVRRVRDPAILAEALRRRGFSAPEVRLPSHSLRPGEPDTPSHVVSGFRRTIAKWLVKPLASGGGQRIRPWDPTEKLPHGGYLQEFVDGPSGSIVFAAAGGRAVPLAISRQLVGEGAFGAAGFQYCGNILTAAPGNDAPALPQDADLAFAASALAQAVAEEFGLLGVNGIDFVARDGIPYAVEVNPRWCSSMELAERAYGVSAFEAHASACTAGRLPEFDLVRAQRGAGATGKAVIYARRDVIIGDTDAWHAKDDDVRDIPHRGDHISAGRPVCTVFATGLDFARCHDALVRRAARVYAQLDAWSA